MNSATTIAVAKTTPTSVPKKGRGARRDASKNIDTTLLLHEDDFKAITGQVLSAVMEKIIPLLEKIEQINKTTDHPAVANIVEMSAEQTAAKQLQQQLQTMAHMKLKSLEERVAHRIKQMQGK
jgi:hypothetical protein